MAASTSTSRLFPVLKKLWQNRRAGVAVVLGLSALTGLAVAFSMPRGPATASQALAVMLVGLGTGLLAGLVLPSRWAMLLAPCAHVLAIEIGRIGVDGPTVDAIRLDSAYGILALILGRGFHGLVGLLPMVLGRAVCPFPGRSSLIWSAISSSWAGTSAAQVNHTLRLTRPLH